MLEILSISERNTQFKKKGKCYVTLLKDYCDVTASELFGNIPQFDGTRLADAVVLTVAVREATAPPALVVVARHRTVAAAAVAHAQAQLPASSKKLIFSN